MAKTNTEARVSAILDSKGPSSNRHRVSIPAH